MDDLVMLIGGEESGRMVEIGVAAAEASSSSSTPCPLARRVPEVCVVARDHNCSERFLVGLIGSVELGVVFGPDELATEEDQGGVIEHSQVPAGIVGEDNEVSRCPDFDSG